MKKYPAITAVIILVTLFTCMSCVIYSKKVFAEDKRKEGMNFLAAGNKAYDDGLYIEAVESYKKAWDLAKLPEACYNLATTLDIELNKNEEAIVYYKKYMAITTNQSDLDYISEMMAKANVAVVKEASWKNGTNKQTERLSKLLVEEYKSMQNIKYDDTSKKEMLSDNGKPFTGLASVCLGCHATFMGPKISMSSTHPVGRIPKGQLEKTVPKSVRFYKKGRVICLSCHNPQILHFEAGSKGKTYRVLRVDTGKNGEQMPKFCAFCHRSKSSLKFLGSGEKRSSGRRRRRRGRGM